MSSVVIVMGVSGAGKTTVAKGIAAALNWPFKEGDALHPAANVAKMAAGHPLDDADRGPWLATIAEWIQGQLTAGQGGVVTCSALKRRYRQQLGNGKSGVRLLYLKGDRATLEAHVQGRHHEFMPASLLDSQLDTLEEPAADEHAITLDVGKTPEETVREALARLRADGVIEPTA